MTCYSGLSVVFLRANTIFVHKKTSDEIVYLSLVKNFNLESI
jgi:hypothetical protein